MKYIFTFFTFLILTSTCLGTPLEFTGFELGTRDDINANAGSSAIVCSLGGTFNPENITPKTGRCAGRVHPSGANTGSYRLAKVSSTGGLSSNFSVNTIYYRFSL